MVFWPRARTIENRCLLTRGDFVWASKHSTCVPTHTVVRVMRIPTHLDVARTNTTVAIAIRVMREAYCEQGDASQPLFFAAV